MKKTYYIWIACSIGLTVGIGTMGVWGLSDTTSVAIAWGLGLILIVSVFVVAKAAKSELASSLSTLREQAPPSDIKVKGSYNAYHHEGEKFKTMMPGDPAVIDFNDDLITIRVRPDGQETEKSYFFKKDETEILWVGNSGRLKDYLTWLEIKNTKYASLISAFMGTYHESTERYTEDLYFKLADCGYKAGVDIRKRGIVFQAIGSIALFLLGVSMLLDKSWFVASCSIAASIVIMALEFRPRKAPKRRNG